MIYKRNNKYDKIENDPLSFKKLIGVAHYVTSDMKLRWALSTGDWPP